MLHCFSRRAKLLKATATNYKHACTCKHSSQPLSTPWSRSKLSLPKLKASLVACFRHLLAENSVANQNSQQPTKYFSAQRKLPRTVENFENSLAPEDILIAQHLQLRCSHFLPLAQKSERGLCPGGAVLNTNMQ